MDKFQNQASLVINLDELQTSRVPEEVGLLTDATDLTIQVAKPAGNWSVYPPLSWYETRVLKEPFRKLPESIGQLKLLKSLKISGLDIHKLPASISELSNLEFLDVSFNKLVVSNELPKLNSLSNLRHLRILGNHYEEKEMQEFIRLNPTIKVVYKDERGSNKSYE